MLAVLLLLVVSKYSRRKEDWRGGARYSMCRLLVARFDQKLQATYEIEIKWIYW